MLRPWFSLEIVTKNNNLKQSLLVLFEDNFQEHEKHTRK